MFSICLLAFLMFCICLLALLVCICLLAFLLVCVCLLTFLLVYICLPVFASVVFYYMYIDTSKEMYELPSPPKKKIIPELKIYGRYKNIFLIINNSFHIYCNSKMNYMNQKTFTN